jgi:UDP-glucose 4-epimerase
MKSALITGANGFIGQKLCSRLDASGVKVTKLVRELVGISIERQYKCELGFDLIPEVAFEGVDTVFHLAGVTHDLKNSPNKDKLYIDINVVVTEKIAMLAAKKGVKSFIYVSSVKAGGVSSSKECMNENDEYKPDGIYGQSKRNAELKLLKIWEKTGIHICIVRPSLVYGPGVKGNLLNMLKAIEKGWFPPLPEVGNRRSMIHVDDLVDLLLLVESDKRSNGEIFIATDGNFYSSNTIYKSMRKSLGMKNIKWAVPNFIFLFIAKIGELINSMFPFPFDLYRYNKLLGDECYSSDKIEKMLGFKAKRSFDELESYK